MNFYIVCFCNNCEGEVVTAGDCKTVAYCGGCNQKYVLVDDRWQADGFDAEDDYDDADAEEE